MNDESANNRKSGNGCLKLGCSCMGVYLLGVLFWMYVLGNPLTPDGYSPGAVRAECLNNLKQIGIAILMYEQDWDNHFPPVSGFGSELDKHPALWNTRGDIFNPWKSKHKYLPELLAPYVKNPRIFECTEETMTSEWAVPDGKISISDNGCSYTFNAWCITDSTKRPPDGCRVISGTNAEKCNDIASAPLVWDVISGYATKKSRYAQFAHGSNSSIFYHFNEMNMLYADAHVKMLEFDAGKPPFNATKGGQGHFWGAPDPKNSHGTLGAQGWEGN